MQLADRAANLTAWFLMEAIRAVRLILREPLLTTAAEYVPAGVHVGSQ